jgi:large subunit ribosomal protein L21
MNSHFRGIHCGSKGQTLRLNFFGTQRKPEGCGEARVMYAIIRTGGKQYRVAPGDVLRVEKLAQAEGNIEFTEVLAASTPGQDGAPGLAKPNFAKVLASVVNEGRSKKVLVFHLKRKKQYKKLQGHRQAYTEIRIQEIQVDGQSFTAAS